MQKLTAKQIRSMYKDRYVDIYEIPTYIEKAKDGSQLYEVRKSYKEIHENTCRAEDVGTSLAFTR